MKNLDAEEREILDVFETGDLKSVQNVKAEFEKHQKYAHETLQRMPEQMSLPDGWKAVPLGTVVDDVLKVQPKDNPEKPFHYLDISSIDNSRFKITAPKKYVGKDAPSRARQLVKTGDILFSTVRTYLKNIAQVPSIYDGEIASTGFCVIRPSEKLNKSFCFYLTLSHQFIDPLSKIQRGTSYPAVRNSDVFEQNIPLPTLPEQEKIVAKIEELFTQLDAGVAELKNARAQLKRYRQSVLKSAVEGELTKEWRESFPRGLEPATALLDRILEERREKWKVESGKKKYKEPAAPDVEGLPDLPEGWVWATLPQLGELNRGKSKHRPRNAPHLYGGPYPFVQTGDVRHANGTVRNYSQTYSEDGLAQSRLWKAGTLCITIAANIADTAILGFDACFPDSIVGFLCEEHHCNIRYIEYFLRTAKTDLERYAPATAQKNINVKILSELAIPLPPLKEQEMFVNKVERRLSVADEIEKELDEALVRAERLRQSVLKSAFEGRLV